MFIIALLSTAKTRFPSVGDWLNKLWLIYTIPWNTTEQWNWTSYWHMQQLGWISTELYLVKKSQFSKDHILCYSVYTIFLKKQHFKSGEQFSGWQRLGMRQGQKEDGCGLQGNTKEFCGDTRFTILMWLWIKEATHMTLYETTYVDTDTHIHTWVQVKWEIWVRSIDSVSVNTVILQNHFAKAITGGTELRIWGIIVYYFLQLHVNLQIKFQLKNQSVN